MTQSSPRPNLILMFSDQQHWQAMGHVDPFFQTPHLDEFAQDAVAFDQVFCTTPQCSPSRASMMTGLYPHRTGVMGNVGKAGGSALKQPTLGSMLQQAGYRTGYFGKWHLGDDPTGNAGWDAHLMEKDDEATTEAACAFVEDASNQSQPFAMVVSYINPHDIYQFRKAGDAPDDVPLPRSWEKEQFHHKPEVQQCFMIEDQGRHMQGQPRSMWQRYRWWYRQMAQRYDEQAGKVLTALRRNGAWEKSAVILTSDHGDMDTQHKLIFKGPFMYEHMMRVPMLARVPAAFGGRGASTCPEQVVLTDLVPTLRELAQLPPIATDGQSLTPLLCENAPGQWRSRPFVIGQYYSKQSWVNPMRMIRTPGFKLIQPLHGLAELYDLQADPDELTNLSGDQAYAATARDLHAKLQTWMEQHDDPFHTFEPTDRLGHPRMV